MRGKRSHWRQGDAVTGAVLGVALLVATSAWLVGFLCGIDWERAR